jgi:hypothetical protein
MTKNVLWVGVTLCLLGFLPAAGADAQPRNDKTVLTFSQAVEIPGHVLPAGTYTFKLLDSMSDRHIVQVFNADGSEIIATIMAIPNYRLKATEDTVIRFTEVPMGSPEAIRAWFYPGDLIGQEFVYSKRRAAQLARASKTAVPAIAADVADADALRTAPIVAITADEQEMPVAAVIQTTPPSTAAGRVTAPVILPDNTRQLPQTAGSLSLIALFGLASLIGAVGVMVFNRRAIP